MLLDPKEVTDFIDRALAEDIGRGDLTTMVTIPEGTKLKVAMVTRQPVVVCGMRMAAEVFHRVDPSINVQILAEDGTAAAAKTVLARIDGDARAILSAERAALNIVQHLSGISTLVRQYA